MTGYPVILGGDHAAYEMEHANTPPRERPDWPLPSFDARDWAESFCKIATALGYKDTLGAPIDEGWMTTWFANALMRGYDEHAGKSMLAKRPVAFRVKAKNGDWILYEDEEEARKFAEATRTDYQGLYVRGIE